MGVALFSSSLGLVHGDTKKLLIFVVVVGVSGGIGDLNHREIFGEVLIMYGAWFCGVKSS